MDVALVHWPAEAERLTRLRQARVPRLVIVDDGDPPVVPDALEDWLRAPPDDTELRVRTATLQQRSVGVVDGAMVTDDGVLRVGAQIVVLPPIQARLAGALLERLDGVVGRDALARRAWPDGAPEGRNVLDVHIAKLRRLLAGTGLDVRTVHRRGYLLHRVGTEGLPVT
ncbi:MAG: helix-turn-helix domain-containing protein [Actinomycetes bacterium]